MPFEAASTVFAGQPMQIPTVHPLAEATKMRNANINTSSVPSNETGRALSQAPLSFSDV